jgi:hypothetical protein
MPLAFFNHCWKAHRYTRITNICQLASYHATCEMVARSVSTTLLEPGASGLMLTQP